MVKLQDKSSINKFILLCCAVYFTSYLTRKNYDAALVAVCESMAIAPKLAGLASTGAVITYGAGQLLSGVLGDKFRPKNIIFIGLIVTAVCNILMPLSGNIYIMIGIWCVNGLAQAMMWPPIVRIMSETLETDDYKKGVLRVTIASSISTIVVYILVPICINISSWNIAFFFCGAAAVLISLLWKAGMKKFEAVTGECAQTSRKKADSGSAGLNGKGFIFVSGLIPISLGIILQGTLRDGVTTWFPTIISDVYKLDVEKSIVSTVALPILGIFSATAASAVQRKFKNEVTSALIFFGVSLVSSALLIAFYSSGVIVSVVLMALITACMHGINLMLVCEVPNVFSKYNMVSTISGILNSFTYVGSAISIYSFADVAERFESWTVNFTIWLLISTAGAFCCLIALKKWKKFKTSDTVNVSE